MRAPLDLDGPQRQTVDVERNGRRDGGALDGRQRSQTAEQPSREVARRRRVETPSRHVVRRKQHAVASKAGIDVVRLGERPQEHPGGKQHDDREAHFDRHQHVAKRAAARRLRTRPNRRERIDAGELQRRAGAEQHAARDAEERRKPDADDVELGLKPDRERADDRHGAQRVGRPGRDRDAEERARQREQQAFDEQQRRDARSRGAHGEANADLALAPGGAREQQVRGVAAHREQQHQHDRLQQRERVGQHPLRTARRLPERQDLAAHLAVGLRMDVREIAHRRVELRLRGVAGDAAPQPSEHRIAPQRSIVELRRSRKQRRRHRRRRPQVEVIPPIRLSLDLVPVATIALHQLAKRELDQLHDPLILDGLFGLPGEPPWLRNIGCNKGGARYVGQNLHFGPKSRQTEAPAKVQSLANAADALRFL